MQEDDDQRPFVSRVINKLANYEGGVVPTVEQETGDELEENEGGSEGGQKKKKKKKKKKTTTKKVCHSPPPTPGTINGIVVR